MFPALSDNLSLRSSGNDPNRRKTLWEKETMLRSMNSAFLPFQGQIIVIATGFMPFTADKCDVEIDLKEASGLGKL